MSFLFTITVLMGTLTGTPEQKPEDQIEKIMAIFSVDPKLRTPFDSVRVSSNRADIELWRTIPSEADPRKVECIGYRYLFGGRNEDLSRGAPDVFKQFPELQTIALKLVQVSFDLETSDGGHGKYEKKATEHPYLEMEVTREDLVKAGLDPKVLKASLFKSTEDCLRLGQQIVSKKELKL